MFDHISLRSSQNEICFRQKLQRKSKQTFYIQLRVFENHAVCEIMWKNIVEPGRPQMTTWRMRIACWISKATSTHSEYVILFAFPLQQSLHERASMLRYKYIACLVRFFYSPLLCPPAAVGPTQWVPDVGVWLQTYLTCCVPVLVLSVMTPCAGCQPLSAI